MTRGLRIAAAGVLALSCAGCVSSGPRESSHYYVLEDAGARAASGSNARALVLLAMPTTAPSFYETQDIVYSRAPGSRAYYQFQHWTEPPARRIGQLLFARLARSGAFETVADATSGIRGRLMLSTHLAEFYHDAAVVPGSARIVLTAELIDSARRVLIARHTFVRTAPAATYDAPGAVAAFDAATTALLDDVVDWLEAVAPR